MHETVRQPARQSPDRPDGVFSLVAGLYVALLLSPGVVFAATVAYPLDAGGVYLGLLAALTLLTVGVAVGVGRVRGIDSSLGASRFVRGLAVPPVLAGVGYALGVGAVGTGGGASAAVAGVVLAGLGIVTGLILVAMSRSRYAKAVVDDDAVRATWKAGWPQPLRTRVQVVAMGLYLGGMALLWGGEFVGLGAYEWLGAVAFVPGGALIGWGQPRDYRLAPVGIERSNYVHRRLYEWDGFESFSVTDEAVVLRRTGWRPAFRCWREDIEDEAELIDALEECLCRA